MNKIIVRSIALMVLSLLILKTDAMAGVVPPPNGVLFETYCSTNTPEAIPDSPNPGIGNDLDIASGPTITDVNVRLYITHTWDEDLDVSLD